jgi:hypothetical protein
MDSSTSDFNIEEDMEGSESSSNVYSSYNQYSNVNEGIGELPDNEWMVSGKKKKTAPKAQVFSSYVQNSDRLDSNNRYQSSSIINNQMNRQRNDMYKKEHIKKPKLVGQNAASKDDNVILGEELTDSLFSDFIGLQTFESTANNIFTEFIDTDLILFCLDSRPQFKSKFCFKGKCKFSLVYGQININGFDIKTPKLVDNKIETNTAKWFDLYSAETNSYLSILNTQNVEANCNQIDDSQKEAIAKQMMSKFNLNIDNSQYLKFKEFMSQNKFTAETSSLFALKILKSQSCDYLSYYENFHHIYQSGIGLSEHQDFDSKLAKLGIFPVEPQNFSAIKIERNEEKQIAKEILNNIDGE